jgi:hypothetical protein
MTNPLRHCRSNIPCGAVTVPLPAPAPRRDRPAANFLWQCLDDSVIFNSIFKSQSFVQPPDAACADNKGAPG